MALGTDHYHNAGNKQDKKYYDALPAITTLLLLRCNYQDYLERSPVRQLDAWPLVDILSREKQMNEKLSVIIRLSKSI